MLPLQIQILISTRTNLECDILKLQKGLSFISNRQRRKEGTFCASGLAGIEPTPPAPKGAGYVRHDHSATVGMTWPRPRPQITNFGCSNYKFWFLPGQNLEFDILKLPDFGLYPNNLMVLLKIKDLNTNWPFNRISNTAYCLPQL